MKNECDIVQDLLFSYKDGCLKQGSKEFVENHLKDCIECNKIYEEMNKDEINSNVVDGEVDYLKKIKKKMKKKTKVIIGISIILFVTLLLNIAVFINYNNYANTMEIFLDDSISNEERSEIEDIIKEIDNEAEIKYKSKEDNLNEMKKMFSDGENLLVGYEGENNIFPNSYEVISDKNSIIKIRARLKENINVKKITTNTETNPYVAFFAQKIKGLIDN